MCRHLHVRVEGPWDRRFISGSSYYRLWSAEDISLSTINSLLVGSSLPAMVRSNGSNKQISPKRTKSELRACLKIVFDGQLSSFFAETRRRFGIVAGLRSPVLQRCISEKGAIWPRRMKFKHALNQNDIKTNGAARYAKAYYRDSEANMTSGTFAATDFLTVTNAALFKGFGYLTGGTAFVVNGGAHFLDKR